MVGRTAAAQFRHLLDLGGQGNVSIRVVPWSAGLHGGMAGPGGFLLLRFPREPHTGEVLVRDSKHPDGPVLHFTRTEWAAFLGGVHDGEFTL
ncbi:MAG: Scr1 family TA system antitoxin-like transcriptional regulator [Kineosporiaceae bacterium]